MDISHAAGALDYVENYAIHRMLGGFEGETLPRLSWWCAAVKFSVIIPLGLWGLAGVLVNAVRTVKG